MKRLRFTLHKDRSECARSDRRHISFSARATPSACAARATAAEFRYSPRPDTPAEARRDQVPDAVKAERLQRLQQISKAAAQRYASRLLGTVERVLVESRSKLSGLMTGTSDRYLQVEFAAPNSLVGQLVPVRLVDLTPDGVLGELTTA